MLRARAGALLGGRSARARLRDRLPDLREQIRQDVPAGASGILMRSSVPMCGVFMLAAATVVAAAGCSSPGQLAVSTTSPTPQNECGRPPGTAGTWRTSLGYCEY